MGTVKQKKFYYTGLPAGYEMSNELKNADRPRSITPSNIHYIDKHVSLFKDKEIFVIILFYNRFSNYELIYIKHVH